MFVKDDKIFGTYVGTECEGTPTIADLIEALKEYPQDTEVILDGSHFNNDKYNKGDPRPYNHDTIGLVDCDGGKVLILTPMFMGYGS